MTEKLRKAVFIAGNVIFIPLTPIVALFLLAGIFLNTTDAPADATFHVMIGAVYGIIVWCFYAYLRKPYEGNKLQRIMIYAISALIVLLIVYAAALAVYKSRY
ncbi:hypothetical protein ACLBWT_17210 [Paenibacillus sp. D51F]